MKKIILAFDGTHFSEGAFQFARRLNESSPILLTGVFLPQSEIAALWSYAEAGGAAAVPLLEPGDSELVKENIDRFEVLCKHHGIQYRVHKDFYDFVLPELKRESTYADLIILGSEVFYDNISIHDSYVYLQQALHDVACPVLLVPEKFNFPESIILAYDGKEDSIFAIKQFAYLFPELCNLPSTLVYAGNENEDDLTHGELILELASLNFSRLSVNILDIKPRKQFATWMLDKKASLLVSGAYGRSGLSQVLKGSFAKEVITDHKSPVFVAHR